MPICIAGMHRSGTSMVARLLKECGLYLGPDNELIQATPANPDGHWEHVSFVKINESILEVLGGSWYSPPPITSGWTDEPKVEKLKDTAANLIKNFDGQEPWGWKDPRNTLTVPFWMKLLPELKVVICLRNPLEVAESLRRRQAFKFSVGYPIWRWYKEKRLAFSMTRLRSLSVLACLDLWKIYNQRILEDTAHNRRIITQYESYFRDPVAELRRVLEFLDVKASEDTLVRATTFASTNLRHHHLVKDDTLRQSLPSEILNLYERMSVEAEFCG